MANTDVSSMASLRVLEIVLDYLPAHTLLCCRGVCSRLQQSLDTQPMLWTRFRIESSELRKRFSQVAYRRVVRCGGGELKTVDLRGCSQVGDILAGGELSTSATEILRCNEKLQLRCFERAVRTGFTFNFLRVLDLQSCKQVTDAFLCAISGGRSSCSKTLQVLDVRDCLVGDNGVMSVLLGCGQLRQLDVSRRLLPLNDQEQVSDRSLLFLAQKVAVGGVCYLEQLSVAGQQHVTDEGLSAVLAQAPSLRHIDAEDCPRVLSLRSPSSDVYTTPDGRTVTTGRLTLSEEAFPPAEDTPARLSPWITRHVSWLTRHVGMLRPRGRELAVVALLCALVVWILWMGIKAL